MAFKMKGFPMQKGTGSYLKKESAAKMKKEAMAKMKKEAMAKMKEEEGMMMKKESMAKMKEAMKMKKESMAKQAKPDFPDIDGDGNTKESMKKAAADKKSPTKQKKGETGKEEQARKDKEDKAFMEKREGQIQSNIDKMIKEEQAKYNKSMDSLNTVRGQRKTQQQKDYETMSAAEYNKKYGGK